MRSTSTLRGMLVLAALAVPAAQAESFSYQGHLRHAGAPLNGTADLQFRLYTAAGGGSQIGATLTAANVSVVDGLVMADLDFGPTAFDGSPRWLQVSVRSPAGSGSYTNLAPRQALLPAPYAIYALGGLWASSGDHIYKTNDGNVGIGTTSPSWPLHVIGDGSNGRGITTTGTVSISKGSGTDGPGLSVTRSTFISPFFFSTTLAIDGASMNASGTIVGSSAAIRLNNESSGNVLLAEGGGRVGVGTSAPQSELHVVGAENTGVDAAVRIVSGSQEMLLDGNEIDTNSSIGLYLNNNVPHNVILTQGGGRVGIGSTGPNSRLHVNAPAGDNALRVQVDGTTRLIVHNNGNVAIGANVTPQDTLHVSGTTRTNAVRIMGGSDLSERFDVAAANDARPEPGMVVCIDPANPGKLLPSSRAYDRTVAGVISGAGGINSGMIMGQEGSEADGEYPVALTGRVYVLADASAGAIQPGDLLTTSDRAGHAMRVADHARAPGAIIGKAMTGLDAGQTGLVLVLVSLH